MVYRCRHIYIHPHGNTVEALQGALDGVNAVEEVLFAASILGQPPVVREDGLLVRHDLCGMSVEEHELHVHAPICT